MTAEAAVAVTIAALTFLLLLATAFYAWQTKRTVEEMRSQRDDSAKDEAARRRDTILSVRHAVSSELKQIVHMIEGKRGYARLWMWMPSDAGRESFKHPAAMPADVRAILFPIYDEVERMNAAVRIMMLSYVQTETDPKSTYFIRQSDERWTWPDFMLRDIRPAIEMIEALPLPD